MMEKVEFSWLGLRSAWCICALLSCWYIGSLHVLVPKHLRVLERRNPRQVDNIYICTYPIHHLQCASRVCVKTVCVCVKLRFGCYCCIAWGSCLANNDSYPPMINFLC